jgi:phosphomannomutase
MNRIEVSVKATAMNIHSPNHEPMISVSGLRGVVGSTLTPDRVIRYVAAFAASLPHGSVVVTRDGRSSGQFMAQLVSATLQACGLDIVDAGIAATPTTGRLVRQWKSQGGVQVSASHNPAEYNGLKLFQQDGRVIPANQGERVLAAYRATGFAPPWCPHSGLGKVMPIANSTEDHLQAVLKLVDVPNIRKQRYRVLLDANGASGSLLGLPLLSALGCDVVEVGCIPNGDFQHPPEPTQENLVHIGKEVRDSGATIGFCQDPDADRLALIDPSGAYVGEEFTLALCVDHILEQGKRGAIVTNCSTSRMSQVLAEKFGVPFIRSRVGEANVADSMLEHHAVFGGEGNGGPIDPRVGLIRDSFVGMALILDGLALQQVSLKDWVRRMPQTAMHKAKADLPREKLELAYQKIRDLFPEAAASELDGLRLDWPDRWLLLRGSNTEPIVRIMAEGPTAEIARNLCERVMALLP